MRVPTIPDIERRKKTIASTRAPNISGMTNGMSSMGASAKADGSHDVRALQRLVLTRKLRTLESLLLADAIKASVIRRDGSGNPALDQGTRQGRIDALSATVIAAGLSEIEGIKPRSSWRPGGLV